MSLLKKASIITTPTAYAEDYLYSIKPAYALGSELVTNGNFATDSNWSKGTGWSISGGTATYDGSGGTSPLIQGGVGNVQSGKLYKLTLDVINNTGSGANTIFFGGTVVNGSNLPIGSYTFFGSFTSNTNFYIYGRSGQVLQIDNVSVKEVTDADFDFDRNSTGTRVNEDYLIEDVPYNLLVQSNQFDTTWFNSNSTDTSGQAGYNYSNDAWKIDITGAAGYISQSLTQSGLQTASVFVKAGTLNFVRCRVTGTGGNKFVDVNLTNGAIGTTGADNINATSTNIGEGWYRITLTYNATTSAFLIYPIQADSDFTATSGNIFIQYAQLVKGDQPKDYLKTTDRLDIPRIDYTNGEPSILLEPQRQNIITNSNSNNLNFTLDQTSMTYNQIVSPEGLNNGILLQQTGSSATNSAYNFGLTTADGTYTYSIFIKAKDSTRVRFYFSDGSALSQDLDPTNMSEGVISGNLNLELKAYPNGWFRVCFSRTLSGASTHRLVIYPDYNNTQKGVYIYGLQIEAGSYPTSLIHTSGSAVTRGVDVLKNAGNSDLINSTEGAMYLEIAALSDDNTDRKITLSDGTFDNSINFGFSRFTGNINAELISGGVLQTSGFGATGVTQTNYNKFAMSWGNATSKFYVNGILVSTHSSITSPIGLNVINFAYPNITQRAFAKCKMVAVFKEALTDLELAKLTGYNNHELYMNYYNRLSYLGLVEEYNVESDINNYIL